MSKTEDLKVEIFNDEPSNKYDAIINEWVDDITGFDRSQQYKRGRQIEKVPSLLLIGEKGSKNKEYYRPAVISLGPYHHHKNEILQNSEKYKLIMLELFALSSDKTIDFLYYKVFDVIDVARKCYIDGSTNDYNDKQFAQMMLCDGCFVLFFIECISRRDKKALLNNEYLGAFGFANVVRDIFLLENQIPFVILQVLMNLRYDDKGEKILNGFFNYLKYGEVMIHLREKAIPIGEAKQPLHLLELYRTNFISISCSRPIRGPSSSGKWQILKPKNNEEDNFNYVKRNRSFPSAMELKAKGIFLKPMSIDSLEDIKFHSYCYYGQLELVRRAISSNSKAIFLNMIAYEMCPHNPNDFRVSTYVRFMKSLIVNSEDVKELRAKDIMLHSLGRDEEVVKMYEEIETPAVNLYMFSQLKRGIEKHCNSLYKTWVAELISLYFSRPWKAMALFVATAILLTTFLQTFYTIRPLR